MRKRSAALCDLAEEYNALAQIKLVASDATNRLFGVGQEVRCAGCSGIVDPGVRNDFARLRPAHAETGRHLRRAAGAQHPPVKAIGLREMLADAGDRSRTRVVVACSRQREKFTSRESAG